MGDDLEHLSALDCYICLCFLPPIRVLPIISLNRLPGHVDDYVGVLPACIVDTGSLVLLNKVETD